MIRLSGPQAIATVAGRFRGRTPLDAAAANTLHVGRAVAHGGEVIDDVVVGVFRAPHSYTGEDVVEVTCHGSPVIVSRLLDLFTTDMTRVAEPGEFTRRAFLNGRLDLSQAEAVGALIGARSEAAARAARRQLGGESARIVGGPRRDLLVMLASLEAHIDFPEDDLAPFDATRVASALAASISTLDALQSSARRGRPLAQCTTVVIAGRPNVGKSSLFNALLRRDRSIVHEAPGTTRDVVDAEIVIGNVPIRLLDTAGLTDAHDLVEAEGVRRSHLEVESAERVILVVDAQETDLWAQERSLIASVGPLRMTVVANKMDLGRSLRATNALEPVFVSALTGEGIDDLQRALLESILEGEELREDALVVTRRQERLLAEGVDSAREGLAGLERGEGLELVAEALRRSAAALGEIVGENVAGEVLDLIFSEFCIGK